jgi:hypothetical protein
MIRASKGVSQDNSPTMTKIEKTISKSLLIKELIGLCSGMSHRDIIVVFELEFFRENVFVVRDKLQGL